MKEKAIGIERGGRGNGKKGREKGLSERKRVWNTVKRERGREGEEDELQEGVNGEGG